MPTVKNARQDKLGLEHAHFHDLQNSTASAMIDAESIRTKL